MNVEDVRLAVDRVARANGDPEYAHALEDRLFVDVLRDVAKGDRPVLDLARLAETALTVLDQENRERWYA